MLYLQNKNKIWLILIFSLIFLSGFFLNLKPAKADVTSFTAYYLVTSDTTPTIKGTVDDESATIVVTINGHEYNATIDGNIWSANVTDALTAPAEGEFSITYPFSAVANEGEADEVTIAEFDGLILESADFPFEFYLADIDIDIEEGGMEVASITFIDEYTFDLDGFSLHFPSETEVTADGGITFDLLDWAMENIDSSNAALLKIIQFGVPNLGLHFSHPVDISVDVGSSYNGRTLNIFTSESIGGDSADWESVGTCLVDEGSCDFSVDHASYFGISENDNLGGSDHRGGLVYKKYKDYKDKFKNKEDKQRYFKIKWLKKNQKETYFYYKSVYEAHKFDKDSEFNKLSGEIKEIYKNYRGYNGYKNYREYKEKVY